MSIAIPCVAAQSHGKNDKARRQNTMAFHRLSRMRTGSSKNIARNDSAGAAHDLQKAEVSEWVCTLATTTVSLTSWYWLSHTQAHLQNAHILNASPVSIRLCVHQMISKCSADFLVQNTSTIKCSWRSDMLVERYDPDCATIPYHAMLKNPSKKQNSF